MVRALPREDDEVTHVVTRPVRPDEALDTAIVETFLEGGIGVFQRDSVLNDWVDPDALSQMDWKSDPDLLICTRIWEHAVIITSEEVTLYSAHGEEGEGPVPEEKMPLWGN